jgi:hypothetical protein
VLKELSFVNQWLQEREADGRAAEARRMTLLMLRTRFGALPESLVAAVERADAPWCESLVQQAALAPSLSELMASAGQPEATSDR